MKKFLYLAAACLLAACNGGDEPEQAENQKMAQ